MKHYLRGEEGINYVDLYHLVKFLPSYSFPAGLIHSDIDALNNVRRSTSYRNVGMEGPPLGHRRTQSTMSVSTSSATEKSGGSPPVGAPSISIDPGSPTSPKRAKAALSSAVNYQPAAPNDGADRGHAKLELPPPVTARARTQPVVRLSDLNSSPTPYTMARFYTSYGFAEDEEAVLLPAELPPRFSLFDFFPFSIFIRFLQSRDNPLEGKKAARARAKHIVVTRNVPLEISMYLVCPLMCPLLNRADCIL